MFSKYLVCVPPRNIDAESVTKVLVENIFLTYGLCTTRQSDRGTEFVNELSHSLHHALGIDAIKVCAYTPTSSGAIECVHHILNSMFAKCVSDMQTD